MRFYRGGVRVRKCEIISGNNWALLIVLGFDISFGFLAAMALVVLHTSFGSS